MTESVAALYIQCTEGNYSIGLAMVEPYGMRGWIGEIPASTDHPYGAIDQALHLLFVTNCRTLVIGASSRNDFDEIAKNFALFDYQYDERKFNHETQNALFEAVFGISSLLTPIEHMSLESRELASQALALLSSRFQGSDHSSFALPSLLEMSQFMELGNNALEQLEMSSVDPKLPDIASLLLTMSTPMGKRLGRFRLFLPIKDPLELNRRYDWIDAVNPHSQWLEKRLQIIGDLELLWWNLCHRRLEEIQELLVPLHNILEIQTYLSEHKLSLLLPEERISPVWINHMVQYHISRQWIEEASGFMGKLIDWIAQIDVAVASSVLAQRYGLCRPRIVSSVNENFLQIMGLRHLLVEAQGIRYVPNDIVMGNRDHLDLPYPNTVMLDSSVHDGANIRGVLLYGINSSGKSSLMKSVGIAVSMAQSGFFVSAKAMKFSLFEGIYTRIQSRDNVAKSLSTFGVEMLELNTIFSRATDRSLIIGDEISHGTETLSAVAIVASTIMELVKTRGLFLMTTHLHQLSLIDELSRLREVVSLHLSVRYDEQSDRLLYDRLLKPGRGSSVYGLEFAESLHMHSGFLHNARRIRDKLAKEYDVLELGNQKEYIKRYREVVACECVICGALIRNRQIPHLKEHHHLIPLCEIHAREISQGKINLRGFIMTQQGLRLEYETQLRGN
ncbi:MAG: hypothetical protein PHW64_00610 [Sulfuricurvum sp.]|nr:hypothetical protein [Sulfuricurvum sp.]